MNLQDKLKKEAAFKAVEYIEPGMVVGLGTGSTVYFVLERISELLSGRILKDIVGIPSSEQTANLAEKFNIPLTDFYAHQNIDLAIDGADEVDLKLDLIKGGGGALLREKVLVQNSDKFIVVVDESKLSVNLGEKWAVPIEVIPFALEVEKKFLESMGADVSVRMNKENEVYRTDENNIILDANFGKIEKASFIAHDLEQRAGIVEHGLFIDMADVVISAGDSGLRIMKKDSRS